MIRNTFAIKLIIFLISTQLLSGCAGAYATYLSSSNEISICYEPSANFTWLYNTLNNDSILSHDGDIWYLNATMRLYGSGTRFYINDSDVSELRINGANSGVDLYKGSFKIENVTIGSWDYTTNLYSIAGGVAQAEFSNPVLRNVDFKSFGRVLTYGVDGEIYNLTMTDGASTALVLIGFDDSSVHDVTISNYTGGGLELQRCFNTEVYNVRVEDVADFQNPSTGSYGIVAYYDGATHTYCDNITIRDCYINGTGWSGVDTCSYRTTFYNLTIRNAGHNGLDLHGGNNHTAYNISIYDSVSNNLYALMPDCHFEDINLYDCFGDQIGLRAENNTFKNITMIDGSRGIVIYGSNDCKFTNITKIRGGRSSTLSYVSPYYTPYNITFIDADLSNGELFFERCEDVKLINIKYDSYRTGSVAPNERTFYYYPDIILLDSDKNPSGNTSIQFTNEVSTEFPCIDAEGNEKDLFITDLKGKLLNPLSSRTNSPAIAESYRDFLKHLQFTYTATAITQSGYTISLTGITPDPSWYREDPNIPTYTITAIIPDSSSKGPHKTGFAPSEENPFNQGDEKIFRVWTDEPLTSMEWYVDGSPVSGGALSYTWTVTEGDHLIEFKGSNVNGDVNQSWNIGENTGTQPATIIEFFPEDATVTRDIGEPVTFSVNSDQPLTTNWLINGELVRNDAASITQSWDTPGTYEVMVTGTNGEDAITHIWKMDVIDSEEYEDASNVKVSPEYQIVAPNQPFDIDVSINPDTAITGAQFDLQFDSSKVRADSVTEGNLLNQDGAGTLFNNGTIDNSTGTVTDIYGSILGKSNVSSEGVMATISMTAGSDTGIAELTLSNVIVSDSNLKAAPITIGNATVLVDTAPVLNSIGSKSISETNSLNFTVDASDADGNYLTYSATGLPDGANIDPATGVFTWTPSPGQSGVYTVIFEVSDGYLSDSEDVLITVNPPNNVPVIVSFEPENGSSFNEKEEISISVSAFDLDGQFLNYIIKINGVTCSTAPNYIWKTDYLSSGKHIVEVTVNDGIDQVTEKHTIYVIEYHPEWDVVEDGEVNILDIATVAQEIGTTTTEPNPRCDVTRDGQVNVQDLSVVGYHFGEKIE